MEHEPRMEGGTTPEEFRDEEPGEARIIAAGIAAALREARPVDDATAKRIARAIHPGSGPLYELTMTGKISRDIDGELEIARELLPETG